jgi:hypothetical protein
MANPEEAYQIARYLEDLVHGRITAHREGDDADVTGPVFQRDTESGFEFEGVTGMFEVIVREVR